MTVFGVLGLTIAAIGLYGVLSYTVAQRKREFGIRLALGATRATIMRLAVRQGAVLTAAGLAVGAVASALAVPTLRSMMAGLPLADPLTFASVTGILAGVALLACWLPGRAATRIDPVEALRAE